MAVRESIEASWSSLRARRAQVYFHIFIVHIYYAMRKIYNKRYALETTNSPAEARKDKLKQVCGDHHTESSCVEWQWKSLPKLWPYLTWYRWASSIWMMYVVIKYTSPDLLESLLSRLNLSKPARCYILGRFILVDGVERITAIFFAGYHLAWRYSQLRKYNPFNISAIYFLILDDRDITQYNALQKLLLPRTTPNDNDESHHPVSAAAATAAAATVSSAGSCCQCKTSRASSKQAQRVVVAARSAVGVERFMHDVMSYPVFSDCGLFYRLRPNRTQDASKHLRSYMIGLNLIAILISVPLSVGITLALLSQIFNDKRYLDDYAMCSAELEQMRARNELTKWSVHFSGHQVLAYTSDFFENFFLWSECGLVLFCSPILGLVITRDLIVYWEHLDAKITACLVRVREQQHAEKRAGRQQQQQQQHRRMGAARWIPRRIGIGGAAAISGADSLANAYGPPVYLPLRASCLFDDNKENDELVWLDEQLQEIQFEFKDLIKSIKRADHFNGELVSMLLTVWFTLLAYFTYMQQTDLLPALKLTLIFVGLILTALYIALLRLHANCLKSYPKICSLMALANSRNVMNFTYIIDYYVQKQTCYTFYRRVPMTGIQYLTYVGWSLSCLLLVLNRV